jgi:hypothetical protein
MILSFSLLLINMGNFRGRYRKSSRPIVEMSRPSIVIEPSVNSTKRKSANIKLLFPAPVRPTTPIFSWAYSLMVTNTGVTLISIETPLSTGSNPSLYLILTSLN